MSINENSAETEDEDADEDTKLHDQENRVDIKTQEITAPCTFSIQQSEKRLTTLLCNMKVD